MGIQFDDFKKKVEDTRKLNNSGISVHKLLSDKIESILEGIQKNPYTVYSRMEDCQILFGYNLYRKRIKNGLKITQKVFENDIYINMCTRFLFLFGQAYNDLTSDEEKNQLFGRLRKIGRLFPLQVELETYYHFKVSGFKAIFADLTGKNRYDLRIEKNDLVFEVECKSTSSYAGTPIINAAAHEFAQLVQTGKLKEKYGPNTIVEYSFEERLVQGNPKPGEVTADVLLDRFYEELETETSCSIFTDKIHGGENIKETDVLEIINEYHNRDKSIVIFSKGCLDDLYIVVLKSKVKGAYLEQVKKQIEKATTQFTRENPSLICLCLEELCAAGFEDPNVYKNLERIAQETIFKLDFPVGIVFRTEFLVDSSPDTRWFYNDEFKRYKEIFVELNNNIDLLK